MSARPWLGMLLALAIALGPSRSGQAQGAQPADAERASPAQPSSVSTPDPRRAEAQALYAQGNEHFVNREYTEALAKYRAALALWDHPAIRFNIAECYVSLVQPLLAYENLARALDAGAAPLESQAHFERGTQLLERLLAQLGVFAVSSAQGGVRVTLDGKPIDMAGQTARTVVLPGAHQLVVSKPGFVTSTLPVVLSPGETVKLPVALEPMPPPMTTARRWPAWLPWVVTGAGAGMMLLGVPAIAAAGSDYDDYDRAVAAECAPPTGCAGRQLSPETRDLRRQGDREATAAVVLWSVGGAAAVTGAAMLLLNQPRAVPVEGGAVIDATVTPEGGSVSATWTF